MSIVNAKAFYEKVKADQALQQKIGELVKENSAGMEGIVIKVAGENGFQFNLEEMRTFLKELAEVAPKQGELSDAQLEAVAGGAKEDWLIFSYFTAGYACALSGVLKGARAMLENANASGEWCALDK